MADDSAPSQAALPPDDPRLVGAAPPESEDADDDEGEEIDEPSPIVRSLRLAAPGWLISAVVNLSILLILAALSLPLSAPDSLTQLISAPGMDEPIDELETFDDMPLDQIDLSLADAVAFQASDFQAEDLQFSPFEEPMAMPSMLPDNPFADISAASSLLTSMEASYGSDLAGRGAGRGTLVAQAGGSEGSERAVALALRWLAEHQCPDGGWNFDLKQCPNCRGQCSHSGELGQARNAATGLALLPFLGAGQTHKSGSYKQTVERGLYFLTSRMKRTPQGGSFYEPGGRMYSHGICAIAICEAYAMTRDRALYAPAQESINFIVYAQDPVGGGWRYEPREAGDTSVVGWKLMALKSGNMAYLRIPRETIDRTDRFLTSVQADGGAYYGYMSPDRNRPGTNAIGLLCRMYMGWGHDEPALGRGVEWLSRRGPSAHDSYYNYYATQVMRHYEGEHWDKWNRVMRDQLVNSQATTGHETGSWHFPEDHHGGKGGRLYTTAMATMILEVYYRHLPIYRKQTVEDRFSLD